MMQLELYVGRTVQSIKRYSGAGGAVEKPFAPYQQYISGFATCMVVCACRLSVLSSQQPPLSEISR